MYPCPVCGHLVFDGPPGTCDICPICYWEDDLIRLVFPEMSGGANQTLLIEAQAYYPRMGASESRFAQRVRAPQIEDARSPQWRPLDTRADSYLRWSSPQDRRLWQENKDKALCLYHWESNYWLSAYCP